MNNKKKTIILIAAFIILLLGASALYNNLSANYKPDSLVVENAGELPDACVCPDGIPFFKMDQGNPDLAHYQCGPKCRIL